MVEESANEPEELQTESTEGELSTDDQALMDMLPDDSDPTVGLGEEVETTDDEPEQEESTETEEEPAASASEDTDQASDVQGLEEALKALQLDGVPEGQIAAMQKSDQTSLIAYGLKRAEEQRKVSQAFQDRAELRKQVEADGEKDTAEDAEKQAQAQVDLTALTQPLIEELGEDAASSVVQIAQALNSQAEDRVTAAQAETDELRGLVEEMVLSTARQRVGEMYPTLADAATFTKVNERMKGMIGNYAETPGTLADKVTAALQDAAKLELGDPDAANARNRKRSKGQPSRTSRKVNPKSLSADDAQTLLLEQLEEQHGF